MQLDSRIYIAGHRGLVGSALVRELCRLGYTNLIFRNHSELDLTDSETTQFFFEKMRPEYVFLAAAKVGGIMANSTYPADFLYQNLQIQTNVIEASRRTDVHRLLFLGSSCIYPKHAEQPIVEPALLSGPLEPTNRAYAVAKIAGIEMCRAYNQQHETQYLAAMPTNLYGAGDNYDPQNSHVIPAIIRKLHEAKIKGQKTSVIWGTGTPLREFLYSDDLANACVFLMGLEQRQFRNLLEDEVNGPVINIGSGEELSILEITKCVAESVGFTGEFVLDPSKPDGTPRKLIDSSRLLSLGWKPRVSLREGLENAYQDFLKQESQGVAPLV